jgi:hypothetical protein
MLYRWLLSLFGLDRKLFVFFDGRRKRRCDPFVVCRALFDAKDFDWDETPKLLNTGHSPTQLIAFQKIGIAVRAAFDVPTVETGGLSEIECLELLTAFREYLGNVKKNGSLFPILPDSTDSQQSQTEERWPTKPGLDSGSTESEPPAAQPGSQAVPTGEASPLTSPEH